MTIPATASQVPYAGNGVTLAFPIPFVFDTAADIKVILTSAAGLPAKLSTGFAITGGGGSTGTCTMSVAPAVNETLTVLDDPELTQTADYTDNDSFPAESHEAALDRTVRLVKRLHQRINRSIRVDDGDLSDGDDLITPISSARAGLFLAFDANGNPTASVGTGGGDAALRTDLAKSALGIQGARLTGFRQSIATAIARTLQGIGENFVFVEDFGANTTPGATDMTAAIQAATDALETAGGGALLFRRGIYRYNSQLTPKNGVHWSGAGKHATFLSYYGAGISINAVGTSIARKLFSIEDMTIDGTNASNTNAQCIALGWNMRSEPLMRSVRLYNFPHYGINFDDQNWNLTFIDLHVDTCGRAAVNSTGIFKKASVDVGTFNGNNFHNLSVEACGNSTSTAGGINMQTTTANRGLHFSGRTLVEGNLGTLEIFISNMSNLMFDELYIERTNVSGQTQAVEFDGCTGSVNGGYIASSNLNFVCSFTNASAVVTGLNAGQTSQLAAGMTVTFPTGVGIPAATTILSVQAGVGFTMTANATATNAAASLIIGFSMIGLQCKASSKMVVRCVDALDALHWHTAGLDIQGSRIKNENCPALSFRLDATGQIYGDIEPRWSAHKNGTNQVGIVTNVFTKVTFPTETADLTNAWDAATSIGTPKALGMYQIDAQVTWVAGTDLDRPVISVYLNGAAVKSSISQNSGVGAYATKISCQVPISAASDTVEVYVRQTSGGNQDIFGGSGDTWLMASYLGQAA